MVGRLVEHEPVRARGHQQREARARALARGERRRSRGAPRRRRARTWPAASAPPARSCRCARRSRRAARPSPANVRRAWSSSPTRTPGPTQRLPAASGTRPSSASTRVVLPLPFGPTSARRSPHASSRSTGPSAKPPRRTTALVEARGDLARSARRRRSAAAAPSGATACRPRPAARSPSRSPSPWPPASPTARSGRGGRSCRARRRCLRGRGARRSPTTGAGGARGPEPVALGGVALVALLRVPRGRRPQLEVARPAAAELRRGVGDLVELEHARDGALEERAVVGDDHGAAGPARPRSAPAGRARRSRGRSSARRAAGRRSARAGSRRARRARPAPPESAAVSCAEQRGVEAELAADGLRARLEVGAAEREPLLERVRVGRVGAGRAGGHARRGGVHARGGRGHAGPAREVGLRASRRARGPAPGGGSRPCPR